MFSFFYYILVVLIYILLLPILFIFSFKQKYKISLLSRFFLKNNPPFKKNGIWFHACSLGEVNSLKPIFQKLSHTHVNLSVITQTGYNSAQNINSLHVRFLPFEIFLPFWIKKQKTLIVTEAELWPMLFVVSKMRGIKTVLINARISEHSYKKYNKFNWFYRWIFANIDEVSAQSETDKIRLEKLGAKNVHVDGNIKTFSKPIVTKKYKKPNKKMIIIASSHNSEEEIILENLNIKNSEIVVVAPRHPERFDSVDKFLKKYTKKNNLTYSKIKDGLVSDVVLCDKMGELINLYALSDIVILCGSFMEGIGGHNPLEPAFFGTKIISGKYFFNQKELYKLVENIEICSIEELKTTNFDSIKYSNILHVGDINNLLNRIK